jgi:hypothetical protein
MVPIKFTAYAKKKQLINVINMANIFSSAIKKNNNKLIQFVNFFVILFIYFLEN